MAGAGELREKESDFGNHSGKLQNGSPMRFFKPCMKTEILFKLLLALGLGFLECDSAQSEPQRHWNF